MLHIASWYDAKRKTYRYRLEYKGVVVFSDSLAQAFAAMKGGKRALS